MNAVPVILSSKVENERGKVMSDLLMDVMVDLMELVANRINSSSRDLLQMQPLGCGRLYL